MPRTRNACHTCRERHIKCRTAGNSSSECDPCRKAGLTCDFGVRYRFCTVKRNKTIAKGKWVKIPKKLTFIVDGAQDESRARTRSPESSCESPRSTQSESVHPNANIEEDNTHSIPEVEPPVAERPTEQNQSPLAAEQVEPDGQSIVSTELTAPVFTGTSPSASFRNLLDTTPSNFSDTFHDLLRKQDDQRIEDETTLSYQSARDISCSSQYTFRTYTSPPSQPLLDSFQVELPFQGRDEAHLFMYFVENLTTWIDICDPMRHFGTEVPKRAMQSRLLKNAILAYTAKHLQAIGQLDQTHARSDSYYSECLNLLIPILDNPMTALNEDILAAIVILRSFEELSVDTDTGTHLFGSSRLLNSISDFASTQGICEAASWIILRQDSYFALTRSKPLHITNLDHYKLATLYSGSDDYSYTNKVVLLFAEVISYISQADSADFDRWNELNQAVNAWWQSKPWYYAPVYYDDPPEIPGIPIVWMARPLYIMGYQHYYLCQMLLSIFDPSLSKPGFETFRRRRDADNVVLQDIRIVLGLALSKPSVIAASLLCSHALQICGPYLRDVREREQAVEFLEGFQQRTGWRISHIINNLKDQWAQNLTSVV